MTSHPPASSHAESAKLAVQTSVAPGRRLGVEWYTDPGRFELERERLWRRSWVSVGRTDDVTETGSFISASVAGDPVVVVRMRDGDVRAMANVCPHRNTKIVEGSGTVKAFQCPYHNWTFRLDGSLASAPNMADTTGFDVADICLPPVAVELWAGWVFVNIDTDALPLRAQFTGLTNRVAEYDIGALRRAGSFHQSQPWNWKLTVENFSESYHHAAIHPQTLHTTFPGHKSWADDNAGEPWTWLDHVPTDSNSEPFAVGVVFPSHMFSVIRGLGVAWFKIEASGVDTTELTVELLLPEGDVDDPNLVAGVLQSIEAINDEDTAINARVRAGLGSKWARPGPLSNLELGVAQQRDWIAATVSPPARRT